MQDTTISTVTSFIYVNNNTTIMPGRRNKFQFYVTMDAFLSCDKILWAFFQVLSVHSKDLCNKLLEYSFQLHKGKIFIVV